MEGKWSVNGPQRYFYTYKLNPCTKNPLTRSSFSAFKICFLISISLASRSWSICWHWSEWWTRNAFNLASLRFNSRRIAASSWERQSTSDPVCQYKITITQNFNPELLSLKQSFRTTNYLNFRLGIINKLGIKKPNLHSQWCFRNTSIFW